MVKSAGVQIRYVKADNDHCNDGDDYDDDDDDQYWGLKSHKQLFYQPGVYGKRPPSIVQHQESECQWLRWQVIHCITNMTSSTFVGSTPRSAILGVSVNNRHLCVPEATTAPMGATTYPMGATTAQNLPELCPPNCDRTCTVASGPSAGQSCVFPWTYDGTTYSGPAAFNFKVK